MSTKVASKTADDTGSSAAQLREQTDTIKEDIRKLGHIAKDLAHEKLNEARQAAGEAVEGGRQRASDLYEQGREKASELEDQVVDYVRHKPIKSVLIAGGLGLILGALLSRR